MVKQNEKNEGHRINHVGGNPFRKKNTKQGSRNEKEGHGRTSWHPLSQKECESRVQMLPTCRLTQNRDIILGASVQGF